MKLEIAEKIFGWMNPAELTWLARQAEKHHTIAEIGSYVGRSTRALADNTKGQVYAIDTWEGSIEHEIDLVGKPEGYLYDNFLSNVGDLVEKKRILPLRMKSLEAARLFMQDGIRFDMIFIDAGHLYDDVRADIEAWLPLLAPGGIICGHDYSRYSGLDQAVRECVPGFRLMEYPGSIWYSGPVEGQGRDNPFSGPKPHRKCLFTLNIGMNYEPQICELTYPLLARFAAKCEADFHIITERKFPWMPITFEKLQIYELGQLMGNEWNIFFDSDALVHPDTYDPTEHMTKDMVMHNGNDMAGNRWKYDNYFRRDGRHIGSGNWFTVASDWCIDLWRPPDDLSAEHMVSNISPTAYERQHGITSEHLIDDYVLSRNIAKYGLKFMSYLDLTKKLGRTQDEYFWHHYTVPADEKLKQMKDVLKRWGIAINQPEEVKV